MRTPFIAGNWKMNKTVSEAENLVTELKDRVKSVEEVEIGVCPPAIDLVSVKEIIGDSNIKIGAQNMRWEDSGAVTGEISPPMLSELDLDYIIIGHSERREYFGETDEEVNKKVKAAFANNLKPIICVGETLEERENNEIESKIEKQVKGALADLESAQVEEIVIAYEPIWAIGTGESATAEEANRVIGIIRETIEDIYPGTSEKIRVQYGGSVKPHNIEEFMAEDNIDGALVGGASLEAESFAQIVHRTAK